MSLQIRHARIEDLPRVHELVASGSRALYDAATLAELPRIWADWLRHRRLEMHLLSDETLPIRRRIQVVVSGIFVARPVADGILDRFTPRVAQQVLRAELAGKSVLPSPDDLGAANGGMGVDALGLDFACASPDWSIATMVRWGPLLVESLRMWLGGWRLRMGLREVIGRDLFVASRAMGVPVFHRHTREAGRPLPPERRHYLMGMTRGQAERRPARLQALLFFQVREPRFRFTRAEQELLLLALRNHSDAQCARQLHISPHTVKMRWRSIFLRVQDQRPEWFPVETGEDQGAKRGVEKRRHLLAYLQQHVEELRPRAR